MDSENPIGADNQQETRLGALDPGWVVGFVDGEGCFSVSIHRNELARPTTWLARPAHVPGLSTHRPPGCPRRAQEPSSHAANVTIEVGPRARSERLRQCTARSSSRQSGNLVSSSSRAERSPGSVKRFEHQVRTLHREGDGRPESPSHPRSSKTIVRRRPTSMNEGPGKRATINRGRSSWDPQRLHARHHDEPW